MKADTSAMPRLDTRRHSARCKRTVTGSRAALIYTAVAGTVALLAACGGFSEDSATEQTTLVAQGKQIFRFDTFGDEAQWTDTLRIHEVIRTAVDPVTSPRQSAPVKTGSS